MLVSCAGVEMGVNILRALGAVVVACVMLCACGSGQRTANLTAVEPIGSTLSAPQADKLLAELAELRPPELEQQLWTELSARLVAELNAARTYREASAVPAGEHAAVGDFTLTAQSDGGLYFRWSYANWADYNQDGLVNASDLTPIAVHLDKTGESPDWELARLADGNGDGAVTLSDITPIALNWQGWISGYVLQTAVGDDGPWEDLAEFDRAADGRDAGAGRLWFEYNLPDQS